MNGLSLQKVDTYPPDFTITQRKLKERQADVDVNLKFFYKDEQVTTYSKLPKFKNFLKGLYTVK